MKKDAIFQMFLLFKQKKTKNLILKLVNLRVRLVQENLYNKGSETGRFSYCMTGARGLEMSWGLDFERPDGRYISLSCFVRQFGAALTP